MKRKKMNYEDISALFTALMPKIDNGTKRQLHALFTLIMANIVISTSLVTAVGAYSNPMIVVKSVVDINGDKNLTNVTKAGDIITYQINLTNGGNVNLTDVNLTDPLINLTNYNTPVLTPGSNLTFIGSYTVDQEDMNINGTFEDGFITNIATVTFNGTEIEDNMSEDSTRTPIVQNISYAIDKSVTDVSGEGPAGFVTKAGDVITYEIVVTNDGNIDISNKTVGEDHFTDSLFKPTTKPTESIKDDNILEVGENVTVTGNYTVTQEDIDSNGDGTGFITNNASIEFGELGQKNATVSTPIANCTIIKTVTDVNGQGPGGIVTAAGDIITYQIDVENEGRVDLTNVTVTDPMLGILNVTDLGIGSNETIYGNYTVTQDDINNNGTVGSGFIINNATVESDQLGPKNATAEVWVLYDPSYSIYKAEIDPDTTRDCIVNEVGDKIPYRINVLNDGNVNLTNVTVRDILFKETFPELPTKYYGNNDSVLNPGERWEYNVTYRLTQSDLDNNGNFLQENGQGLRQGFGQELGQGFEQELRQEFGRGFGHGYIVNIAGVICDQLDPKFGFSLTPIEQRKTLQVYKSVAGIDEAGDHMLNAAGDVINYQIAVKNVGNTHLTIDNVSDQMLTVSGDPLINLTKSIGGKKDTVLDPGELWVYTGDYTLTEEDISRELGVIANIANVTYEGNLTESSILILPLVFSGYISPNGENESENTSVKPVASFTTSTTSGYAPFAVQFTDTSTGGPTSWSWDFNSDGTEDSSAQSPAYTYSTPGTYVAKLTVINAKGSDSTTATINVQQTTSSGSGGSSGGGHSSGGSSGGANLASSSTNNNAPNVTQPQTTTSNVQQSTTPAKVEPTPVQNATSTPTQQSKKTPGFEIFSGIIGLLGAIYLYRRR